MERILIRFTKTGTARFISHLDTMRTLHRAFRRAELPIAYSQGFNPHPSISVAAPLSLGIGSVAEYADVELDRTVDMSEFVGKLNGTLPDGIEIREAIKIEGKQPTSMSAVEGAKYFISLQHGITRDEAGKLIDGILDSDEIKVMKKTKSGEKLTDIRPLIKAIKIREFSENDITLECLLYSGSRGNLNPELVASLLKEKSENRVFGYPSITREELYACEKEQWIGLDKLYAGR
jgi:radical SAM-linked protein